jgi:hypothetical protein
MTYISQHIMSFVWIVVWASAIASAAAHIECLVHKKIIPVLGWAWNAVVWAIIIVFWFN